MGLGTGRTGLSGPSTPPSFATYSDMSAAVAANGGQPLGPSVSVAGVLWDWSATRGRYIPGNAVSFATYAALPALANTSQDIGVKTWLVNPLTPEGMTRVYWTGTLWAPVPGQIIAQESAAAGALLLDSTASTLGLTVGVMTQVYQSGVLPDWMFSDGGENMIEAEYGTSDASSTANVALVAGVSSAALTGTNNASLGVSSVANVAWGKAVGGVPVRIRREGTSFRGQSGPNQLSAGLLDGSVGSFSSAAVRFRAGFNPGALTNLIRLRSWKLWSA